MGISVAMESEEDDADAVEVARPKGGGPLWGFGVRSIWVGEGGYAWSGLDEDSKARRVASEVSGVPYAGGGGVRSMCVWQRKDRVPEPVSASGASTGRRPTDEPGGNNGERRRMYLKTRLSDIMS